MCEPRSEYTDECNRQRPEVLLARLLEKSGALSAAVKSDAFGRMPVPVAYPHVSSLRLREAVLKHWDEMARLAHLIHASERRKGGGDRRRS